MPSIPSIFALFRNNFEFLPKDYSKLGCMESARWDELAGQLKQVDVVPSDFDPASSFNLSFLGNCE